jgi:hypothetical protein
MKTNVESSRSGLGNSSAANLWIKTPMPSIEQVEIDVHGGYLAARLCLPCLAHGVVLLPHGRGTARDGDENLLARRLHQKGLGTLHLNLLTSQRRVATRAQRPFDLIPRCSHAVWYSPRPG